MPKYLSGRVKRTPQSELTAERYRYLSLEEAEPSLGDPLVGPSSIGAKPVPSGDQYIIVAVGSSTGERFWIPNQGGIIPGSITVFDEDVLVGGLSSTTQLNFVGAAVSALGFVSPGGSPSVAVTISVFAPGNNKEILFNTDNDFSTSSKLTFDTSIGLLSAGDRIQVGSGGTVINTTGVGSVGIGTINPTQKLHVQGNFRLTGTIYDYLNNPGSPSEILAKNNFGGVSWIDPGTVRSGAGGTYQNIQFHNNVGLVDGAPNFVYNEINNRVGIGSTQPTTLLDVVGNSKFTGSTQMSQINVSGTTTTSTLAVSGTSTTRNLLVTGITTLGFLTGSSAYFTGVVTATKFIGEIELTNLNVPGIATIGTLRVTGLTTSRDLQVYESTTLNRLNVSGISTFSSQVNINNLSVTGVGTIGNIRLSGNTVNTLTGNLILDSTAGITQINDSVYINDTTESTTKDTGSIITEGGVGIEKNLFVGGTASLATKGGITTTGGDLYIGKDLYVKGVTYYDEISGKRGIFSEYVRTKDFEATGISTLNAVIVGGASTFNATSTFNSTVSFTNDVTLGNNNSDRIIINSLINSSVLPSLDDTHDIGSVSNRWRKVYANTFSGVFIGNADTASRLQTARNIDIDGDVIGVGIGTTFDGSKNVTIPTVLSTTGVTPGTYGSDTQVGQFIVDSKGRITEATNVNINFDNISITKASYADSAGIATHIRGGGQYQIPIQSSANQTTFIPTGTVGEILQYTVLGPDWTPVTSLTIDRANYADEAGLATDLKINATNRILYQRSNNDTHFLDAGSSGNLLQSNGIGATPSWVSLTNLTAAKASYADSAGIATHIRGGGQYQIPIQSGNNTTTFIPTGTIGEILQYTASGPDWTPVTSLTIDRANYANEAGLATDLRITANNQLLYQINGTNTGTISTGSAGQLLQSNGTGVAPSWVNATSLTAARAAYADSAGIATHIRGGLQYQIPIQSSANQTTFIPTGAVGTILQFTNSGPSWNAVTSLIVGRANYADEAGLATDLRITANNQLLYQINGTNTGTISTGSAGQLLQSNGTGVAPSWVNATSLTAARAAYADSAGVSTNLSIPATNQLLYQASNNNTEVIAGGSLGSILRSNGPNVVPGWANPTSLSIGYANTAGIATNLGGGSRYKIPIQSANNTTTFIGTETASNGQVLTYNTSTGPSWQAVSDLTLDKANYATKAGLSSDLELGAGNNRLIYQVSQNVTGILTTSGTSGQILRSRGSTQQPEWIDPLIDFNVATSDYADNAGIATNIKSGSTYQIPYQTAANRTSFIGTTGAGAGFILTYNTNSAPSWKSPTTITVENSTNADLASNLAKNGTFQLLFQRDLNDTRTLGTGQTGQLLQSNGGTSAPDWVSLNNLTATNAVYATKAGLATDLNIDATNRILYQSALNNTNALGAGTSGFILRSRGSQNPPEWVNPQVDFNVDLANDLSLGAGNYRLVYQVSQNDTAILNSSGVSGNLLKSNGTGAAPSWVDPESDVTVSLAYNLAKNATNRILYQAGNNDTGALGAGTSGYILRSRGTQNPPEWVDPVLERYEFPSGTTLVFYQAAPPIGWNLVTDQNNGALRVVTGAGGTFGGTKNFTTVFAADRVVPLAEHSHTGITSASGKHGHKWLITPDDDIGDGNDAPLGGFVMDTQGPTQSQYESYGPNLTQTLTPAEGGQISEAAGGDTIMTGVDVGRHTHTFTTNTAGTENNTMDFDVKYIDVILCRKI